jgi:wyosine [tRNA(Phe)-imidazoG37] synthetase (radical SAM superfamily)
MENLHLQVQMVYGPIGSHRLGLSLGINLSPYTEKLCSFNCVYCHYGWTKVLTVDPTAENASLPDIDDLERQLEDYEVDHFILDHITFSGNGEATQHPDFGRAVEIARKFRDRRASQAKTAILSNSSTVKKPEIRRALMILDRRIMKVDAGDEKTFLRINRPSKEVKFGEIIEGLMELDDFETQTTFVDGDVTNASEEAVSAWIELLLKLKPKHAQIYTLSRPPADPGLKAVDRDRMRDIFYMAKKAGIPVTLY